MLKKKLKEYVCSVEQNLLLKHIIKSFVQTSARVQLEEKVV
jgi:hypothetical protein